MARMRAPERRRQLLEVSAKLFAKRGYRGTTTAELAHEAGITEPILYRHFDSKLDLFVTLVNEVGRLVIHAWREALDAAEDPHERLRKLLDANPASHARGKSIYRVIFQAMAALEDEPEIASAIRRHTTRLHAFVAGELEHLQSEGVIRDDEPPEMLAWLLVEAAIGYGMVAPLGGAKIAAMTGGGTIQRLLAELLGAGE
jgi:AcrR family transcriptional regulator